MSAHTPESISHLREDHTPSAIRARLGAGVTHNYLRDFTFGAIDGAVTTFAVVAGAVGANLSGGIVVVLGVANLLADGFSMAVSNYLGTRAEQQLHDRVRRSEEAHIDAVPEGERHEIREIFADKGFSGADLERVVEVITADRELWVDTMLREEHGLTLHGPSPARAAVSTFVAFLIVGAIPLIAFVIDLAAPGWLPRPIAWASVLTGGAFFLVGSLKGRLVGESWRIAGAETLALGGAAALLAFAVGYLLRGLIE